MSQIKRVIQLRPKPVEKIGSGEEWNGKPFAGGEYEYVAELDMGFDLHDRGDWRPFLDYLDTLVTERYQLTKDRYSFLPPWIWVEAECTDF